MKLLLVVLALSVSAQTFASDCSLPNKKDFISAKKVLCDDNAEQVLLEGIKITKFGEEKNVLLDGNYTSSLRRTLNNTCALFGLKSAADYRPKNIFSYLETGIEIDFGDEGKLNLIERRQTSKLVPIKLVICNRN